MEETPVRPNRRILPALALLAAIFAFLIFNPQANLGNLLSGSPSATVDEPALTPTGTMTPSPEPLPTCEIGGELPILRYDFPDGLVVFSMQENRHANLFLYHPGFLPLTRITNGQWDDIHPALSPDGQQLAFSSNRAGSWDLYSFDLETANLRQITEFPGYKGAPSWSPDGQFIAYEGIVDDNLEIFIIRSDGSQDPIQLTDDPASDHSPAWSPGGHQIAFVSTRSGESEIWISNLQQADERFVNISNRPYSPDHHPTWSDDGTQLAWASVENGLHHLITWAIGENNPQVIAGGGDWPVFSPDGSTLLSVLDAPNNQYITAYPVGSHGLVSLPPAALPGRVLGLDWGEIQLARPLPAKFSAAAAVTPEPLWFPTSQSNVDSPSGRAVLVPLVDVDAPDPRLLDEVNDSFEALRSFTAGELGWDLLASLENAYVSITSPLPPGLTDDWLYTGRAFAVTTSPVQAGWIVLVREDFGTQTYWRMYVRARFQDGSQGLPLKEVPFNLNARYSGDPSVYEQGGKLMDSIPGGYWVDFTDIALRFDWERQPALLNWRAFYQAARFNKFVLSGGLEWRTAMLNMYPVEALISPSPITPVTPSATPSRTPTPTITPTSTTTPTPSPAPLLSPTTTP